MKRKNYLDFLKKADLGTLPDNLNPALMLNDTSTQLLIDIIKGKYDMVELAKRELENRGVDLDGNWVGFINIEKW
jgi:hypothetical protein